MLLHPAKQKIALVGKQFFTLQFCDIPGCVGEFQDAGSG
jgi:hypothetical protein